MGSAWSASFWRFFFFLPSARAAGPLVREARASDVDLGMAEGSEGIVGEGSGGWEEVLGVAVR